ncbi:MAG: RNA 2',3'-cyclic phosphodiesterase [Desulfuromonas sp.]|mgnify:CR=1 FL=1|nr:MAG: RNA 2',3'-cyclic phosphodiesterase [Desulfuromonas sp.]
MKRTRAFIAIPLPDSLCGQVKKLQHELRAEMPELRTGASQNLHLTLNFLGDQSDEQLAKTSRFMISVADYQAPFSLSLQELGTFPEGKRPRVVWLGVRPLEPLLILQKRLANGLAKLGCEKEKTPYRPHLTLGRFRRPPSDIEALYNRQDTGFDLLQVKSIILYSSRLTPQGAVHQPLTVAELNSR